ncbi:hypothetical protein PVAND_000687 [Polypedilum vanderplanki]|uniref:Uncharacterized protein n=1 Tax=Polypedilum vanderplanki TaxID=319348 RepID=A0A9J6BKX6_POLVA|nr:hypothetical protein PVAND_000687 [Polypedilum vanderplanki]
MIFFERILILILLFRATVAIYETDSFPNFVCLNATCTIQNITSSDHLQKIFKLFDSYNFEYRKGQGYNCRDYGQYCEIHRKKIEQYTKLDFFNATFEKFPSKDNKKFNHIKKLSAIDVGLTEINRDDMMSFKSLEELDLSGNNITVLNNLFLLNMKSLKAINLQNNQISKIDSLAFDEIGKNLTSLNLSFNKLTEISENMLNSLGRNNNSEIFLNSNAIERITAAIVPSDKILKFETLNLSDNKLKHFVYNCTNVDKLLLNDNQLETFDINNCSAFTLNLNNNNLTKIKVLSVENLSISNNVYLKELTLNVTNLINLEMKNLTAKVRYYDVLKNATNLLKFDAANTFLGPLKFDTLAEMKSLQILNLSNTGLTHIEYGMFSHQRQVTVLDISGNELESIDINMLVSLKALKVFAIKNNNLTQFEHVENIKEIFPSLQTIQIDGNHWNCSYLVKLFKIFNEKYIIVEEPLNPVKNSPNVLGIQCMMRLHNKIQQVGDDELNLTISKKLNEIINQINEDKTKRENHKFDADVMKSEIFNIQKEILEIKTKIVKIEMNENLKHASSSNSSVDVNGIKNMMEQLNNITLDRQKIAYDQLVNKINEQGIEIKTLRIEIEKSKNTAPMLLKTPEREQMLHPVHYASLYDSNNGIKLTDILMIIFITSLFIIVVIIGYAKLKKSLHAQRNLTMGVRARSTNTMNTSIELPFADDKN